MTEFSTNALLAIVILLALTFAFIFLFTKVIPLNKIQLKKLDYIWLTVSAFAIFGLVERNRIQLSEIELRKAIWLHEARSNDIFYMIDTSSVCFKYSKSELSPPNFDQLQKMTDSLCSWTKNLIPTLPQKIKNNDSIKITTPNFNDAFLEQQVQSIQHAIQEYNKSLGEILRIKKEMNIEDYTFIIQMLSPLLLILGLAIRFSKTAAEVKLERKNNQ